MSVTVENPVQSDVGNATILIVDDNATNLRVISDFLELHGFAILVSEDGESGLKRADYVRPDLILLDIIMPGMDGFETCRRLKANQNTKDIPVIFMTALTQTENKVEGFQVGGVDYISKPFQKEEVLARVNAHVRLRELTEHLEQNVRERTRELTAANQQLQQEINEREQTEEKLRHLHDLLNNIVNSMTSVLVGVDPESRVTQWNREAERVTGIPLDQALGCILTDVLPQLGGEIGKIRRAIQDREVQKSEKIVNQVRGEVQFSDVTVYPLIMNGIDGAVIQIDNVTERVRIQEMMIQTEKMMTVGGMAAGMAHEINNPLGVILQGIQNTFRRLSPDIQKNQEVAEKLGIDLELIRTYLEQRNILQYLDGMQEAGTRAGRIIKNMLNFSRRSESLKVATDLAQLLEKTIELTTGDYDLKKKYDFRRIEIIREYDPILPNVPCAAAEIQQVVLNLLRNAAQALAEKHEEGYTPQIRIRTRQDSDYAQIEIEDNGSGMDEETYTRIFEPFYTTKPVGIGTGLGLSVSYFIITQHHKGAISVHSEPGKGTNFIIRLPLERHI